MQVRRIITDENNKKAETTTKKETEDIAADCYGIMDFLQDIVVETPRAAAVPLSLRAVRRAREWFQG